MKDDGTLKANTVLLRYYKKKQKYARVVPRKQTK